MNLSIGDELVTQIVAAAAAAAAFLSGNKASWLLTIGVGIYPPYVNASTALCLRKSNRISRKRERKRACAYHPHTIIILSET